MGGRFVLALTFVALGLPAACSPSDTAAPQPPAAHSDEQPSQADAPSTPAAAAPDLTAPPMINGVYVMKDACPGEGCYLGGRIKAREDAALLADSVTGAPATATIAANEWVEILGTMYRLVPLPGTVRATGKTVYMLGYEGEGCSTIWNNGQLSSWCDDDGDPGNDDIVWSPPVETKDPSVGFWVQVKRDNGQSGWLASDDLGKFACTGFQDRDPDCPPLPQ